MVYMLSPDARAFASEGLLGWKSSYLYKLSTKKGLSARRLNGERGKRVTVAVGNGMAAQWLDEEDLFMRGQWNNDDGVRRFVAVENVSFKVTSG